MAGRARLPEIDPLMVRMARLRLKEAAITADQLGQADPSGGAAATAGPAPADPSQAAMAGQMPPADPNAAAGGMPPAGPQPTLPSGAPLPGMQPPMPPQQAAEAPKKKVSPEELSTQMWQVARINLLTLKGIQALAQHIDCQLPPDVATLPSDLVLGPPPGMTPPMDGQPLPIAENQQPQQDPNQPQQGGDPAAGGGDPAAGGEQQSAIPPISPMDPAFVQGQQKTAAYHKMIASMGTPMPRDAIRAALPHIAGYSLSGAVQ